MINKNIRINSGLILLIFVLRMLIGWHFLYEGIVKYLDPSWSSYNYLIQSDWVFSSIFRSMALNDTLLNLVDILNTWGLIFIGMALVLGIFVRIAGISGAILLLLYYLAQPPFHNTGMAEGHYLIVDKNIIEMFTLFIFSYLPREMHIGLQRLLPLVKRGTSSKGRLSGRIIPVEDNPAAKTSDGIMSRREIVKNLAFVPVLGGFIFAALRKHGWGSMEEKNLTVKADGNTGASVKTASSSTLNDLVAPVKKGKIGNVEIGRLICGGNLISGFAHARDLIYVSSLLKKYFSDEKVMETLWLCESCGMNTAILRTDKDTLRILEKYRKRGGKIQWLAQTYPKEKDMFGNINMALDNGAVGAFVQGNIADAFVKNQRFDLLSEAVEYIKSKGVIAGTAGHMLEVPVKVEEKRIPVDFYMKTLHHHNYWSSKRPDQKMDVSGNPADNYWSMTPEKTIAFMEKVNKPWIAYKIFAAGAIPPKEGMEYAFTNGADFACVGMFDFQIVDNANYLAGIMEKDLNRRRLWYG